MGVVNEVYIIKDTQRDKIIVAESECLAKDIILSLEYDTMCKNENGVLVEFLDFINEYDNTLVGDFFINVIEKYELTMFEMNGGLK